MKKKVLAIIYLLFALIVAISLKAYAAYENKTELGNLVNAGNNKFNKEERISVKDKHYGWSLGHFIMSGYTMKTEEDGIPVFLKTRGDNVKLSYILEQDINKLNNVDNLLIEDIKKGQDEKFQTEEASIHKGMLLVKFTDWQNSTKIMPFYDYLSGIVKGAETDVYPMEEGDYEVVLDYAIKSELQAFSISSPIQPFINYYRVSFKFKIRNGNNMVYTFDSSTSEELFDNATTKNGFKIDLAQSRYLEPKIKKEIIISGTDLISEDTRFNAATTDGRSYTEEGIYTITVYNKYLSGEPTSRRIYVGKDKLIIAHMKTGLPIKEIREELNKRINQEVIDDIDINETRQTEDWIANIIEDEEDDYFDAFIIFFIIACFIGIVVIILFAFKFLRFLFVSIFGKKKNKSINEIKDTTEIINEIDNADMKYDDSEERNETKKDNE